MNKKEFNLIERFLDHKGFDVPQEYWIALDFNRMVQFITFSEDENHLKLKITRERKRLKNRTVTGTEAYTELNRYIKVKNIKDLNYSKFFKPNEVEVIKKNLNSNIQQFCCEEYTGKILKATSIDKNGAYLSWFKEPLPYKFVKKVPFSYSIILEPDEVAFYITEDLNGCGWEIPNLGAKNVLIFKTKVLEGSDELLAEYKKSFTKEHAVSSIGFMSRHSLISSFIWHKQGTLINEIRTLLMSKGIAVFKGHTDSITFEPKGYKYVKKYIEDGTFKLEYQDKNIFICHQSAYQVEGQFPKGLKEEDMIDGEFHWSDGLNTKPTDFPCLKSEIKVSVIVQDQKTLVKTRQWKTLLEVGLSNLRE